MGFVLRWAMAFGLLSATFNPTRWNYVTWARTGFGDQMPLTVLLGLLLLVGYIIYLRATLRSIGGGWHGACHGSRRRPFVGAL